MGTQRRLKSVRMVGAATHRDMTMAIAPKIHTMTSP